MYFRYHMGTEFREITPSQKAEPLEYRISTNGGGGGLGGGSGNGRGRGRGRGYCDGRACSTGCGQTHNQYRHAAVVQFATIQ